MGIIKRGGDNGERLYLQDAEFSLASGEKVAIAKTDISIVHNQMDALVARHKGRYGLLSLFCRPGHVVLDAPCGSGYAAEVLNSFGVFYEGLDCDPVTIEYAKRKYGSERAAFRVGDLCSPDFGIEKYNVIGVIEGLEHIEQKFQLPLIQACKAALVEDGVLVISSPEAANGKSGPNPLNLFHKWELTKTDFLSLLYKCFIQSCVEIVTCRDLLSTGVISTCLYGICSKENTDAKKRILP
jgi:2-polyprenyl-3-methyl-5-hydroxy-6-metoxy-1,4-benzoquinol methylase